MSSPQASAIIVISTLGLINGHRLAQALVIKRLALRHHHPGSLEGLPWHASSVEVRLVPAFGDVVRPIVIRRAQAQV
jgi:hypothetical protein